MRIDCQFQKVAIRIIEIELFDDRRIVGAESLRTWPMPSSRFVRLEGSGDP